MQRIKRAVATATLSLGCLFFVVCVLTGFVTVLWWIFAQF